MMPQMNSEEQSSYGQYEGIPPYAQQQQSGTYDDNFVEALAQRIAYRVPQGKLSPQSGRSNKASAGQRLALAIVSLALLIPLAGITMVVVGGILGIIAFGTACAAIFLVNAIFGAL